MWKSRGFDRNRIPEGVGDWEIFVFYLNYINSTESKIVAYRDIQDKVRQLTFSFFFPPVVNSLYIKGKNNSIEIVATR